MEIIKFSKFFEANLKFKDLEKSKDDKLRGDILIDKIRNNKPLELPNGTKIIVTQILDKRSNQYIDIDSDLDPLSQITDEHGNFSPEKSKPFFARNKVFKTSDGNTYKLTDLFKSIDFGSSGAGMNTNENEIIQMFLISRRIELGRNFTQNDVNEYLDQFIGEVYPNNCHITNDFKIRNMDYFLYDKFWMATFKNSINNIANASSGGRILFDDRINYQFYHNSDKNPNSINKVILNKFKILSKADEFSEFPKYYKQFITTDFSKYCPADVWAITSNQDDYDEICNSIKKAVDILDLNRILNAEFEKRTLIPISLKKIGVKLLSGRVITNNEAGAELPDFDVTEFHLEPEVDKGIGSKIDTLSTWIPKGQIKPIIRQRNIKIDTTDSSKFQNVDAEIDGVYARHGKINFTMMKKFIEESPFYKYVYSVIKENPLQTVDELKEKTVDELKNIIDDINYQISKYKPVGIKITYDLKGRNNNSLEKKLISKIQSLQIIRALSIIDNKDESPRTLSNGERNTKNEVDKILTKILLYALSIHTGGFSTPRYARVI
jgi:hypothetical protein